jgi:hypothetical protein
MFPWPEASEPGKGIEPLTCSLRGTELGAVCSIAFDLQRPDTRTTEPLTLISSTADASESRRCNGERARLSDLDSLGEHAGSVAGEVLHGVGAAVECHEDRFARAAYFWAGPGPPSDVGGDESQALRTAA